MPPSSQQHHYARQHTQAGNHPKAITIQSTPDTGSTISARWQHGNRTGLLGGHSQSVATEDGKTQDWVDGKATSASGM